ATAVASQRNATAAQWSAAAAKRSAAAGGNSADASAVRSAALARPARGAVASGVARFGFAAAAVDADERDCEQRERKRSMLGRSRGVHRDARITSLHRDAHLL